MSKAQVECAALSATAHAATDPVVLTLCECEPATGYPSGLGCGKEGWFISNFENQGTWVGEACLHTMVVWPESCGACGMLMLTFVTGITVCDKHCLTANLCLQKTLKGHSGQGVPYNRVLFCSVRFILAVIPASSKN